ncbi:hypothetical protein O7628_00345 [Micromonospora sp. WMMD956]|uniref:hypothetical protein n=1 Tax=Micromonospora sp. WMMD956 TaxID=3016108 RepID=UPI002417DDBB|nr:hypothetical protein [Micromonospora sp. WMMD956]MDG4813957.1 hypothetical protein [Micromonospora sp. WMMD956]
MHRPEPAGVRNAAGPIVAGDLLDGRKITGFAYAVQPTPPTAANDRLLFDGDDALTEAPAAVLPQTAAGAERIGIPALDKLNGHQRTAASPGLAVQVEDMLRRPGAQWRSVALPLFDALYAAGHEVWIAGGAVRDLVTGEREVNDLDLSGTAPPGRFCDVILPVLRVENLAESEILVCKDTLVCSTSPFETAVLDGAYIEYRSLALIGHQLPGTSSDFAEDAAKRDLSFNTLHYDRRGAEVLDPTGRGLADLTAAARRFFPCRTARDDRSTAAVVLRAVKQAARWSRAGVAVDLTELSAWIAELAPEPWRDASDDTWRGIRDDHAYYLAPEATPAEQRALAARLGARAQVLVARLLEEAS